MFPMDSVPTSTNSRSPGTAYLSDTAQVTIHRSIDGEQIANRLPSAVQRFVKGRVKLNSQKRGRQLAMTVHAIPMTIKVPLAKATGTANDQTDPTDDETGTVVEIAVLLIPRSLHGV